MRDTFENSAANPRALKIVLGLGALFVLVLVGVRLTSFIEFARAVLGRVPIVVVEPETAGSYWLAIALAAALLAFLLPRAWRKAAWAVLFAGALLVVGISGNSSALGGSGLSHTPVAHWLQSRGYARCSAKDQVRGSGRGTRGEYVAEGWAQPGACPAAANAPDPAQRGSAPAS